MENWGQCNYEYDEIKHSLEKHGNINFNLKVKAKIVVKVDVTLPTTKWTYDCKFYVYIVYLNSKQNTEPYIRLACKMVSQRYEKHKIERWIWIIPSGGCQGEIYHPEYGFKWHTYVSISF